jgi:hypothetical protein
MWCLNQATARLYRTTSLSRRGPHLKLLTQPWPTRTGSIAWGPRKPLPSTIARFSQRTLSRRRVTLLSWAILALFFRECRRDSSSFFALQRFGYRDVLVLGDKNASQTKHLDHCPEFLTAHTQRQQFQEKIIYALGAYYVCPFLWSCRGKLNPAGVTICGVVDNHLTGWH